MSFINLGAGFRATGKGLSNRLPDYPANEHNGNGLLENTSPSLIAGEPDKKLWLFVTGLQTGWKVAGAHVQTQQSRTFNPQHLMQDELVIMGQVANQYEYDRIVQFVTRHHVTAQAGTQLSGYERTTGHGGAPVSFRVVPYLSGTGAGNRAIVSKAHGATPPIHVEGYITEIAAGAERFTTARPFELKIKVTEDFLSQPWEAAKISGVMFQKYLSQFGPFFQHVEVTDPGDVSASLGSLVGDAYESVVSTITDGEGSIAEDADAIWNTLLGYGSGVASNIRGSITGGD